MPKKVVETRIVLKSVNLADVIQHLEDAISDIQTIEGHELETESAISSIEAAKEKLGVES